MSRRIIFLAVSIAFLIAFIALAAPAQGNNYVLSAATAAPTAAKTVAFTGYVSKGNWLVVHDTPHVYSATVATLKRNDTFTVLGVDKHGYWVKIKTSKGVVGWVSYFSVLLSIKRNKLPGTWLINS